MLNNPMLLTAVPAWLQAACRAGTVLVSVVIAYLALMPQDQAPAGLGWDKLNHIVAFFVLAAVLDYALPRSPFVPTKPLTVFAYSALIELMQLMTNDRSASWADLVAGLLGIVCYGSIRVPVYVCVRRVFC